MLKDTLLQSRAQEEGQAFITFIILVKWIKLRKKRKH
jgi:hypothetical protein